MATLGEYLMGAAERQAADDAEHEALLRKVAYLEHVRALQEAGDGMQEQSAKVLGASFGIPTATPAEIRANTVAGSIVPRLMAG